MGLRDHCGISHELRQGAAAPTWRRRPWAKSSSGRETATSLAGTSGATTPTVRGDSGPASRAPCASRPGGSDRRQLSRGWYGLRHTFASIFAEQDGSVLALKDMLGHSSLATSLLHAHLTSKALAADVEKMKL